MAKIVGVRIRKAKDVCFFDPGDTELVVDDWVIVEIEKGWELARVVIAPKEAPADQVKEPVKPIVRKAFVEDVKRGEELEAKEKDALAECGILIDKLKLPMKLLSADYDFDMKRVTIYFRSEERVDFRELVRDLAGQLHVRVELRQTRPRDEAKALGGCGRCGRTLCCSGFLHEFAPVSIKMAKVQNLPLNPMKISGVCGRLMCCLVYENEFYQLMKGKMPRDNVRVSTATGFGKVVGNNPLKETVLVLLDDSEATVELPLAEITIIKPDQQPMPPPRIKEPQPPREKRNEGRAPLHGGPAVKALPPQSAVKPQQEVQPQAAKAGPPTTPAVESPVVSVTAQSVSEQQTDKTGVPAEKHVEPTTAAVVPAGTQVEPPPKAESPGEPEMGPTAPPPESNNNPPA